MILWFLVAHALLQSPLENYSLRAVVSDSKGRPVRDLEMEDVSLTDGGATLPLTRFERDERPTRVALLIDSSEPVGSGYRLQFVAAAAAFIGSLDAHTRVSVWTTGDRPNKVIDDLDLEGEVSSPLITSRLSLVAPSGGNTILDAIVEAAEDLRRTEGERKIVVFLSGDGPGFSSHDRQSVADRVLKTGVEVAGVLVQATRESTASGGDVTSVDYGFVFSTLTEKTGGRFERPLTEMAARPALGRVAADLRSTYRLSFHSGGDRRFRLALQVARPAVAVRMSTPRKEIPSP